MQTLSEPLQGPIHEPLHLLNGRIHEAEGRGRASFALFQAVQIPGPIVWVVLGHDRDRLMPGALPRGVAERLHLAVACSEMDLLWAIEEALRARPVGLVVAAMEKPISLTMGRRLQLASETGGTTGLLLIRQGGGSNASETRWICESLPGPGGSTHHRWVLIKNKKGTIRFHDVSWDGATAAFDLVSSAGERRQPEGPPR